jgi:hypothetical protein
MAPVRIPQLNKQPFLFQAVTAVTNLGLTDFRVLCCWITNAREAHCGGNAQCLTWVLCHEVTPVHTALRNCTRDEGRPFEFGNQVLISSHRKLLSAKATVVNVAEKVET